MFSKLRDNIFVVLGFIVATLVSLWIIGCEPKTQSLIDPQRKVTAQELQIEINQLMSMSKVRFEDLQRQQELRNYVFNQTLQIMNNGSINPVGLLTSAMAIAGIGAGADNVRLRRKIKNDSQSKQSGKDEELRIDTGTS